MLKILFDYYLILQIFVSIIKLQLFLFIPFLICQFLQKKNFILFYYHYIF